MLQLRDCWDPWSIDANNLAVAALTRALFRGSSAAGFPDVVDGRQKEVVEKGSRGRDGWCKNDTDEDET